MRRSSLERLVAVVLLLCALTACGERAPDDAPPVETPVAQSPATDTTPEPEVTGPLRRGIQLPSVLVSDIHGQETDIRNLLGERTLIFFISTSCEVCKELVADWREYAPQLPSDMKLIAVVDESVDFGKAWAEKNEFPLPLFMDTHSVFSQAWGMDAYPTVAGVTADGWIAFARRGIAPDYFTPARAETLIARGTRILEP